MKGFRTSYHLLASVNIQMNNDNKMLNYYTKNIREYYNFVSLHLKKDLHCVR